MARILIRVDVTHNTDVVFYSVRSLNSDMVTKVSDVGIPCIHLALLALLPLSLFLLLDLVLLHLVFEITQRNLVCGSRKAGNEGLGALSAI